MPHRSKGGDQARLPDKANHRYTVSTAVAESHGLSPLSSLQWTGHRRRRQPSKLETSLQAHPVILDPLPETSLVKQSNLKPLMICDIEARRNSSQSMLTL